MDFIYKRSKNAKKLICFCLLLVVFLMNIGCQDTPQNDNAEEYSTSSEYESNIHSDHSPQEQALDEQPQVVQIDVVYDIAPVDYNLEYKLYESSSDNGTSTDIILPPKISSETGLPITVIDNVFPDVENIYSVTKSTDYTLAVKDNHNSLRYISLYDDTGEIIYEYYPENSRTVHDTILTDDYIYAVESTNWSSTVYLEWNIISISIATKEIQVIATAQDYSTNILPRIINYGNDILFYSQYPSYSQEVSLFMYSTIENQAKEILKMNNFVNPNITPMIDDTSIYFSDYDKSGWYVAEYDLVNQKIDKYYPRLEGGYIEKVSGSEKYIAYTTDTRLLYIFDKEMLEITCIDTSIFSFDFLTNHLIYSSNTFLYSYDIENGATYTIKNSDNSTAAYGFFMKRNNHIFISGREDGGFHSVLELK